MSNRARRFMICDQCGRMFNSSRIDAVTCSDTCRKRRLRAIAQCARELDAISDRLEEEIAAADAAAKNKPKVKARGK